MNRSRQLAEETVSTAERLGEYVVTQAPMGFRPTGLPAPRPRVEDDAVVATVHRPSEPGMPVGLHVVKEMRGEPRLPAALEVRVSHPGSDTAVDGITVDISRGGMCLDMADRPPAAHLDIEIDDGARIATAWAQVVGHEDTEDGGCRWHIRITAADDNWEDVVAAVADPDARGSAGASARHAAAARTA